MDSRPSPLAFRRRIDRPRGVAQPGSAPGWGPGGRRFKSCLPDYRKSCKRIYSVRRSFPQKCREGIKGASNARGDEARVTALWVANRVRRRQSCGGDAGPNGGACLVPADSVYRGKPRPVRGHPESGSASGVSELATSRCVATSGSRPAFVLRRVWKAGRASWLPVSGWGSARREYRCRRVGLLGTNCGNVVAFARRGCVRRQAGASKVRGLIAWRPAFRCSSPCRRKCSARQGSARPRSSCRLATFRALP